MNENGNNTLFDKFEIIECFKKDDYTGVYLARHIFLNKEIILKCLNTKTVPDNTSVERFKREAKILAKLDHPNIIKVLDFGMHDEYFYISFEYYKGGSLREVIKESKLTVAEKRIIIIQIFEGLAEAHNNGIIHRDIKPENIFVDARLKVKIGDFGLALSKAESFVTSKSSIVGTPCYMSPEQIGGNEITVQTDLFSLGIVIYELYTGNNPFLGNDISESINNIISKDYSKLLEAKSVLPGEIIRLLDGLVVRSRKGRINSAEDGLLILGIEKTHEVKQSTSKSQNTIVKPTIRKYKTSFIYTVLVILMAITYIFVFSNNNSLPNKLVLSPTETGKEQQNSDQASDDGDKIVDENEKGSDTKLTETTSDNVVDNELKSDNEYHDSNADILDKNAIAKFGELFIECSPWANVFVDSKEYDTTPLKDPIRLTAGRHTLELKHPQFPRYTEQFEILANKLITIKVNLDTLYGYIDCKVFPWGDLYINSRYIGQTPFSRPLQLVPGKYTLQVSNPHYESIYDTVYIMRNDTINRKFTFSK